MVEVLAYLETHLNQVLYLSNQALMQQQQQHQQHSPIFLEIPNQHRAQFHSEVQLNQLPIKVVVICFQTLRMQDQRWTSLSQNLKAVCLEEL